jgi:hypothetical protein
VHDGLALGEALQHPVAGLQRDLGHDATHGLDEVEVRVVHGQARVVLEQRRSEAAKLAEHLDAGESTTDDDDGQQTVALRTGGHRGCALEVVNETVADRGRLLDRLKTDRLVGDTRNRECARDRSGRHNDGVIALHPRLAIGGRDRGSLRLVVDLRDLGGQNPSAGKVTTDGHDRVPRLDGTGRDLGQKGLVRPVRERVNNRDLGLTATQPFFELPGSVKTGVAAADDQNLGHRNKSPRGW